MQGTMHDCVCVADLQRREGESISIIGLWQVCSSPLQTLPLFSDPSPDPTPTPPFSSVSSLICSYALCFQVAFIIGRQDKCFLPVKHMGSQLNSKCMDDRNYSALKARTAWDPNTNNGEWEGMGGWRGCWVGGIMVAPLFNEAFVSTRQFGWISSPPSLKGIDLNSACN